jgi:hypothetical protein
MSRGAPGLDAGGLRALVLADHALNDVEHTLFDERGLTEMMPLDAGCIAHDDVEMIARVRGLPMARRCRGMDPIQQQLM